MVMQKLEGGGAARRAGWLALASLLAAPAAQAVDVDAGDYTALPPGTNLALVYFQHAGRDTLYGGGDRQPIDPSLDSNVGILRGVHYMEIGGFTVDPQFLLPFGRLKAGGDTAALGDARGLGDLILAATVWLVNKPEEKTWFGITPFLYLPTGRYDNKDALNLGENRWKFALQAGYIQGLGDKFSLDLIGDVTLYGKNDDFGTDSADMKQDASFQFQTYLRYHLSQTWDLRAGYSRTWGGETKVDGVDRDDRPNVSKFSLGTGYFLSPTTQLLATWGRDISVDNGFKEDNRINLRMLFVF